MSFSFTKYSGSGNTFLLFDNRAGRFPTFLAKPFCENENVDGLILLENSEVGDYKMRIFNRDGSEAAMCGNGLRCFAKFLSELGLPGTCFSVETGATPQMGCLTATLVGEDVSVSMGTPHSLELDITFEVDGTSMTGHFVNTGVPHFVIFSSPENIDSLGRSIRFHPRFAPAGTNVNFVSVLAGNEISVRTYERGVEAETGACGTGACAAALISFLKYGLISPISVHVSSGEVLKIDFTSHPHALTLTGKAERLSEGTFVLNQK